MDRTNLRVVSHSLSESTAVEKPQIRVSKGFRICHWCERQIIAGDLFFIQGQTTATRSFYAKLCFTCGKEKRGSIWFNPFICSVQKTSEN